MSKGHIYVISGPSGVGKGTVVKELVNADEKIEVSVSATTRLPREGEVDKVNYFFMNKEQFEKIAANDGFMEYATYCDNMYGTPKEAVYERINLGYDVILEIDIQGGLQILSKFPDAKGVFILPPSFQELEDRLRGRNSETDDVIAKRLAAAREEIRKSADYDYFVVNDTVEHAVQSILNIIKDNRE